MNLIEKEAEKFWLAVSFPGMSVHTAMKLGFAGGFRMGRDMACNHHKSTIATNLHPDYTLADILYDAIKDAEQLGEHELVLTPLKEKSTHDPTEMRIQEPPAVATG